jgi:8-hydroxy-5-deazaflavin:NADPH oxidoreductase
MKIGVLGTGSVGRTMAARFAGLGHDVTVGTRDAATTAARTGSDAMGNPPFSAWAAEHPEVTLGTFAEAAVQGEIVVNATGGAGSIDALTLAGADHLRGKVLLDIANPLDFSRGFPPSLSVKDTDSLGEQIQRSFPDARVVKALNTMTAGLMADPAQLAGGEHTTFVSGNDDPAKKTVTALLESMGHDDIIDLGDITTARGTEMIMPIWLRLFGALGTPIFNIKVVR